MQFKRYQHLPAVESFRTSNDSKNWHVLHERYEIVTIQKGYARATYRGAELHAPPNTLGVFEPDTTHHNPDNRSDSLVLFFEPEYFTSLLPNYPPPHRVHFRPRMHDTPAAFQRLIRRTHRLFDIEAEPLELEEQLARIVNEASEVLGESTLATPPPGKRRDEARVRYIRQRLDEEADGIAAIPVTLAQLAGELNCDKLHVLRAFKRQLGITPHQYVIQRRVSAARRLLARGHGPAHVASAVGFADQSHLTRHFKRVTGVTPARYGAG